MTKEEYVQAVTENELAIQMANKHISNLKKHILLNIVNLQTAQK